MKLKDFDISFIGLKQGKHEFEYELGDAFFEYFGFSEFRNSKLTVLATLTKGSTMMELHLSGGGTVEVDCDITNEPFELMLNPKLDLVIKFGAEFNDEDDELLILPHGEYQFNIAQYLYEMSVLSLPQKRTHPGIEDGTLKSPVLDKLEDLKPRVLAQETEEELIEEEDKKPSDPRWDALKNLLNNDH